MQPLPPLNSKDCFLTWHFSYFNLYSDFQLFSPHVSFLPPFFLFLLVYLLSFFLFPFSSHLSISLFSLSLYHLHCTLILSPSHSLFPFPFPHLILSPLLSLNLRKLKGTLERREMTTELAPLYPLEGDRLPRCCASFLIISLCEMQ